MGICIRYCGLKPVHQSINQEVCFVRLGWNDCLHVGYLYFGWAREAPPPHSSAPIARKLFTPEHPSHSYVYTRACRHSRILRIPAICLRQACWRAPTHLECQLDHTTHMHHITFGIRTEIPGVGVAGVIRGVHGKLEQSRARRFSSMLVALTCVTVCG